jgi:hypothetical protein
MRIQTGILLIIFCLSTVDASSQTCEELMEYIKEKGYGTTYTSYNSDAIIKVTFYDITVEYKTHYFAIVCFKRQYSYNCTEYIYQVDSRTKFNYSMNYMQSAGEAFWDYIQPYSDVLGCGAQFKK